MEPRVSLITIGVGDLARSKAFYTKLGFAASSVGGAEAVAAGATVAKPAHDATWGGRSGYFADPDGHLWEVAWNPHFPLSADGALSVPP